MPSCPNGHVSADPDYCDTCGTPLGAKASAVAPTAAPANAVPPAQAAMIPCPACNDLNVETNLFCEMCGYDFVTGQAAPVVPVAAAPATPSTPASSSSAPFAAAPAGAGLPSASLASPPVAPADPGRDLGWTATLTVDRAWFAVKGEGIGTPPDRAPTVVELRHVSAVIGRSRSTGEQPGVVVDDDHGISRRHAELTLDAATNVWKVTDLSSTNGTYVLDANTEATADLAPIAPGVAKAIGPNDQVHIGAWTRLTLTNTASQPADPVSSPTGVTGTPATGAAPVLDPVDPGPAPVPDPAPAPDPVGPDPIPDSDPIPDADPTPDSDPAFEPPADPDPSADPGSESPDADPSAP